MSYEEITVEVSQGAAVLTINRPEHANKLTFRTTKELTAALRDVREDVAVDVAIITGAGDRFFCIGGEHAELERLDYSNVMPVIDLYELIDSMPKPVIAAVNGFAVGGGNVLQLVCDLSVASSNAVFRQVGPMVGSFDAGYGTWYLEESIGRRRAKEMWYLNKKYSATQALEMGLVNEVCEEGTALARALEIAEELRRRGPFALASLKTAFSGRHTGVVGQARMAHDMLLTAYRGGQESNEMSASFEERRNPDREKFYQ